MVTVSSLNEIPSASAAAANPVAWAAYASGGRWKPYRHHRYMGEQLMRLARGDTLRLVVSLPPRAGKSELISRFFPSWWMGTHPGDRVILVSMQERLTRKWSRQARDDFYQHGETLWGSTTWSRASTAEWEVFKDGRRTGGSMSAVGAGGTITGKGAHCLPAGSLIETEIGPVAIEDLCRGKLSPRVLSLNHATGGLEWRRILATSVGQSSDFVEVTTRSGNALRCTSDHRVYVDQLGYRSAGSLVEGNALLEVKIEQGVRQLREAKGRPRHDVLGVLSDASGCSAQPGVRLVQEDVYQEAVRRSKATQAWTDGGLLFGRVLQDPPLFQEQKDLRRLRGALRQKDDALLRRVSDSKEAVAQTIACGGVSRMRDAFQNQVLQDRILFTGVRECGSLQENEGPRKFSFQAWPELHKGIHKHAPVHSDTRRRALRGLPLRQCHEDRPRSTPVDLGHSPYQRSGVRQCSAKSGDAVRRVPLSAPYLYAELATKPISVARRIRTELQPVYDLQVDGNANFFADGVLVHNCLIVDDLIRNMAEAQNDSLRESMWDWFRSACLTRLEPPGRVVILMTRWHHDDLIGRLKTLQDQGELGEKWEFVNLPAIADEDDPIGRKPGEALWPEWYPLSTLEKRKKDVGPFIWESLYQGRPTPIDGAIFKNEWFRYYDQGGVSNTILIPNRGITHVAQLERFATVDLAASTKRRADYTVIAVWGFHPEWNVLVLLDLVRERMEGPRIVPTLKQITAQHDLPIVYAERVGAILEHRLGDVLKEASREGVPIRELDPSHLGKKEARAIPATGPFAAGQIYFPRRAPWLAEVEAELLTFPDGKHDDVVDAVTQATGIFQERVRRTKRRTVSRGEDQEERPSWQIGR